jgi:small subunit ribosomal protein S4e
MARGPKKHLKRMFAPSHWCLDKLSGVYATRPSQGPHKLRECIPMSVLLRSRLKYALSNQESMKICKARDANIKVDGKVKRDHRYPLGFQDVLSIAKTGEHFRMLYDIKGRFQPHAIDEKESKFKLCKVIRKVLGKNKVPYVVTHDGRTIRFPHPDIKKNDTVKLNLETHEIDSIVKFDNGASVFVTGGNNIGRVGILQHVEHHPGSYEIAHVKDTRGNSFATRLSNIFVIGEAKKPLISLPKAQGIRLTLVEERDKREHRSYEEEEQ